MGEFVKRKHPDIFFSPAIDMELRSDVSLTFLEALIHMIGMFMIHLYEGEIGYIRFGDRSSSSSPSLWSGDCRPGCKGERLKEHQEIYI